MDERTLRAVVRGFVDQESPDYEDALQEARLRCWEMDQRFDPTRGNRHGYLTQRVRWHLQNVTYRSRLQSRRDTIVFARQPWPTVEGPDTRDYDYEALLRQISALAGQSTGQARELWRWAQEERGHLTGSYKRSARLQWRKLLRIDN